MHPKTSIQRLSKLRDKLVAEADALKLRIEGIDLSIAELQKAEPDASAEPPPTAPRPPRKRAVRKRRAARGDVKATLDGLLKEVGGKGLNAAIAVQMAELRGLSLDRNTVSSLLSRWKNDGVVDYDGDKYRLKNTVPVALVAPVPAPPSGSQKAA